MSAVMPAQPVEAHRVLFESENATNPVYSGIVFRHQHQMLKWLREESKMLQIPRRCCPSMVRIVKEDPLKGKQKICG